MFSKITKFLCEWRALKAFKAVPRRQRRIVFYTEGEGYWTYFQPVFEALRKDYGEEVLYVTSSERDPLLHSPPEGLVPYYVGHGSVRTLFFANLDADIILMSMPDLQTFHIKRSQHSVKYVYLHHSLVSTHMVYRPEAFDHFDVILCAGPHHIMETRAREALYNLPAKQLVKHGYGRLDTILISGCQGPIKRLDSEKAHVLVAPTWGVNGLLELHAQSLIDALLKTNMHITIRPHPRTRQLRPDVIAHIERTYGGHDSITLDEDANANSSLLAADIMISDWSGAALEYAFGLERPVVFIDVPRKVQNPDYSRLDIQPLEARIREQVGTVLPTERIGEIGSVVKKMVADAAHWQTATRDARSSWVFNLETSGTMAANALYSLLPNQPKGANA